MTTTMQRSTTVLDKKAISAGFRRGPKNFAAKYCRKTATKLPDGWVSYDAQFESPIKLTKKDVEKGIRGDSRRCPIARAAKRSPIGRFADDVVTCRSGTKFVFRKEKLIIRMRHDHKMLDAISVFDFSGLWLHAKMTYRLLPELKTVRVAAKVTATQKTEAASKRKSARTRAVAVNATRLNVSSRAIIHSAT